VTEETKTPLDKNGKNDLAKMIGGGSIPAIVLLILIQTGLIGPDAQQKEIDAVRSQAAIISRLDRLEEKFDEQADRTTEQINQLRLYTESKTQYRWTISDMQAWAAQLRAANENITVPNPYKIREQDWGGN
jgi:hypothetical protein